MAAFTSTISIPAAQLADAPQLEPAFEHLLRNSSVHESVISTLRVNAITDRDTFVNMFDSDSALKEGASDLGFDLTTGGLPHKREFARVVTSWKTAKVMSETKLQTDAVARAHGVPVTLLPCDWTSLLTEFKNKFGKHIPDDKLPAQSMFENFSERVADGTLKAEPLSHVGYFDMVHIVPSAPATLDTQGSPSSAQDLFLWVCLHFRQTRPRRSTRPIELWNLRFGLRSRRSNAHQNSLVSILCSLKTWEDIVYMVPLPCGYYGSFVFLRAYVMLGVQLPTYVSSPDQSTNVRLEFSPTVPLSVLFCFWAGQTWLKFRTLLSTKALCLCPVHVAVSTLLLLA